MSELMNKSEVQWFLNGLGDAEFIVIHKKKDGTQSAIVGRLDPNAKERKEQVPVKVDYCEKGWKSFNVNQVLSIDYAYNHENLSHRIKMGEYK